MKLYFAKEFARYPFGLDASDGRFNGVAFREQVLVPRFEEALARGEPLEVVLDDVHGLSGGFMAVSFGWLADYLKPRGIRLSDDNLKILGESWYHELCGEKIWEHINRRYANSMENDAGVALG